MLTANRQVHLGNLAVAGGALAPFLGAQPVMHFSQDSTLYEEGDDATCYYRVVSGLVRTCRFSQDGRRHIDAFYKPGDVFGFEPGATYRFTAEAVTDCTVIPCRRRGAEEPEVQYLYSCAMEHLARAQAHAQLLGRGGAAQRMAGFLLEISVHKQAGVLELPMTRQDIADYLGLTIETVSRTLAQLQKLRAIRLLAARRIEITSRATLQELCG